MVAENERLFRRNGPAFKKIRLDPVPIKQDMDRYQGHKQEPVISMHAINKPKIRSKEVKKQDNTGYNLYKCG